MKLPRTHVSRLVGTNPVAQAVARETLRKAILDQKIALYMLNEGEQCSSILTGAAAVMQTVLTACQMERVSSTDVSILKGSLNACLQVILANKFDKSQTIAIEQGLDKSLLLATKVKPASINKALTKVVYGMGQPSQT